MVTDLLEENPNHILRDNNGNDVGPDGACEYGAHILRDIDGVNDVDTGPNNDERRDEVGHKGGERGQLLEIKEVIGPSHVVDGVGLQELHETEIVGSCIMTTPLGQQDSKLVDGRRDDVGPNGVDRVQLLEVQELIGPLHEVGRETEVIGVDCVQLLQDAHEMEVIGSAPDHVGLWSGDLQVGQDATIAPTCQNMVEYVAGLVKKIASNHEAAAQFGEEIRESEFVVGSNSSLCSSVEGVAPGRGGAR
ncbi:ABC transporter ATP-binding protein [Sesbania bispinosa]|nr:ABC transporter ATP-binding protein [Sesbania bispinosa]